MIMTEINNSKKRECHYEGIDTITDTNDHGVSEIYLYMDACSFA